MALVRVYCGLSSRQPSGSPAATDEAESLTVAVVDDSGRLLHVCDIPDTAAGYAKLGAVLAERSGGADVAVAADSEEHHVTQLLAAAGRPLCIAEEELLDDYAERFGDDDSPDEREAPATLRRAIGLARALQAGALAAAVHSAPRELTALRPVLAAHAAVASGRQAAAVALREVLRELYPAALRAYPDPAEPVPLAILDALPEPGLLGTGSRSRDEAVVVELTAAGVGDTQQIGDAVIALRVAIAETPRRTGIGKALTTAVAETIQQSVAAVRACDTAATALIGLLAEKATADTSDTSAGRRRAQPLPGSQPGRPVRGQAAEEPTRATALRARTTIPPSTRGDIPVGAGVATPAAALGAPVVTPAVVTPTGATGTATAPPSPPGSPTSAPPGPAHRQPDHLAPAHAARDDGTGAHPTVPAPGDPYGLPAPAYGAVPVPAPRPAPDIAPPGSRDDWPLTNGTYEPSRGSGESARDSFDSDAYARDSFGSDAYARDSFGSDAYALTNIPPTVLGRSSPSSPSTPALPPAREGRIAPPWQDESLAGEPPTLSTAPGSLNDYGLLAEPDPLLGLDPTGEDGLRFDTPYNPPPLRLVEPDSGRLNAVRSGETTGAPSEEIDGDLLIFAEARSAWFTGHVEQQESSLDWNNPADLGWRAAERAAEPILGEETMAGLPRRVPQANLVPGSPLPPADDRSLRIVRDPAAMAAHTTGYFRGSRRGEEVRGFAVGGRPGRESAGGWEFSRDSWEGDRDEGYEYRSAARH